MGIKQTVSKYTAEMDRLGVQLYFFIEIDHSKVSSTHYNRIQTTNLLLLFTSVLNDCRSFPCLLPSRCSWHCLWPTRRLFTRTLKSLCVAHVALAFGWLFQHIVLNCPSIVKFGWGPNLSYMCLFLQKVIFRIQKDMCLEEIGLRAQNTLLILYSI